MQYLDYLIPLPSITTDNGDKVDVFELKADIDEPSLEEWAAHFRQNYCSDDILEILIDGTGMTKEEYLLSHKFPDKTDGFGPGTRSGDFGELLISDYLEFVLGYTVPRERYKNKFNRSSSTQGTDVLAYKISGTSNDPNDELVTFEVKAQASGNAPQNRLQDAINDSFKDPIRKGETLSALRQLYIEKGKSDKAQQIRRFQNKPDNPYVEKNGAAAVHDIKNYSESVLKTVDLKGGSRWLIVIKRAELMKLVHSLYERAAKCN
ncbi:MAG TPA: SAVED domain-containing protein [Ruminococcus sp.]|nr:SAVED domain-containing protein [Ruminococcus sp.]